MLTEVSWGKDFKKQSIEGAVLSPLGSRLTLHVLLVHVVVLYVMQNLSNGYNKYNNKTFLLILRPHHFQKREENNK